MFRSIPTITKNLLIINVLAFLATLVLEQRGIDLTAWGGLHFFMASRFHLYQFITYQFLHGGFQHLFFNMFALWMFGGVIEQVWGPRKFLFYYLMCGVAAGLCQEAAQYLYFLSEGMGNYNTAEIAPYLNRWVTIGASGAVYGILLAFGMTFPNNQIFLFPIPVPIKAKWFVMGYAAIELFSALSSPGDGVAHVAHLGGMFFGFLLIRYWQKHPGSDYDLQSGRMFFDRMKNNFERRNGWQKPKQEPRSASKQADMEYNARKRRNQEEIDRILDKIRKSGYDSLTKEEKQRLFEASREQ